jgi:hypothetical protein
MQTAHDGTFYPYKRLLLFLNPSGTPEKLRNRKFGTYVGIYKRFVTVDSNNFSLCVWRDHCFRIRNVDISMYSPNNMTSFSVCSESSWKRLQSRPKKNLLYVGRLCPASEYAASFCWSLCSSRARKDRHCDNTYIVMKKIKINVVFFSTLRLRFPLVLRSLQCIV